MPQPTASDVHVNMPLTIISIAWRQDQSEFVADQVFPNVPVQKQADRYYVYDRDNWFRAQAEKRGLAQESAAATNPLLGIEAEREARSGAVARLPVSDLHAPVAVALWRRDRGLAEED